MTRPRQPLLREGITEAQIDRLVRDFYAKIRADPELAPIFERAIPGDWGPHLATMRDFWSSLMLTTGRYSGRPLQKHLVLKTVRSADFDIWLRLFNATALEVGGEAFAAAFMDKAERVAASFKAVMFYDPAAAAPVPPLPADDIH